MVTVVLAAEDDFGAFREPAGEVEDLFGPMVDEPGFHDAVRRNISRRSALLARDSLGTPAGGLLFPLSTIPPTRCAGSLSLSGTALRAGVKLFWPKHSASG